MIVHTDKDLTNRSAQKFKPDMVLQSVSVTRTEKHSASDHPDNPFFVNQCLQLECESQHPCTNLESKSFFDNSTNSLQNDPLNRQRISYKMNGPNPAKPSDYISRLLYDSDFMPKSSILLLLQYCKVQAGSLQNGLRNGP
jgi:hypothetical protein